MASKRTSSSADFWKKAPALTNTVFLRRKCRFYLFPPWDSNDILGRRNKASRPRREGKIVPLEGWTKQILNGFFYRNEETPRVLRRIYNVIDEDFDDQARADVRR